MLELFNKVFAEGEQKREKAHSIYNEYCGLIQIKAIHIKKKGIGNGKYKTFNFNKHTERNENKSNNRNTLPRERYVKRHGSKNNNGQSNLFE